jgi:hypothetical protein
VQFFLNQEFQRIQIDAQDVILLRGSAINVTNNLYFKVVDDDDVRFYPLMKITIPILDRWDKIIDVNGSLQIVKVLG